VFRKIVFRELVDALARNERTRVRSTGRDRTGRVGAWKSIRGATDGGIEASEALDEAERRGCGLVWVGGADEAMPVGGPDGNAARLATVHCCAIPGIWSW